MEGCRWRIHYGEGGCYIGKSWFLDCLDLVFIYLLTLLLFLENKWAYLMWEMGFWFCQVTVNNGKSRELYGTKKKKKKKMHCVFIRCMSSFGVWNIVKY